MIDNCHRCYYSRCKVKHKFTFTPPILLNHVKYFVSQ